MISLTFSEWRVFNVLITLMNYSQSPRLVLNGEQLNSRWQHPWSWSRKNRISERLTKSIISGNYFIKLRNKQNTGNENCWLNARNMKKHSKISCLKLIHDDYGSFHLTDELIRTTQFIWWLTSSISTPFLSLKYQ